MASVSLSRVPRVNLPEQLMPVMSGSNLKSSVARIITRCLFRLRGFQHYHDPGFFWQLLAKSPGCRLCPQRAMLIESLRVPSASAGKESSMYYLRSFRLRPFALASGIVLLCAYAVSAQNYVAPSTPVIGSANTVTANAPIPRPTTTPCTVTLFQNLDFSDFNPKYFSYTPPAGCPGPWAAVVFEADWSVDAGRQFDRTAEVWIGGANVYFGTTAEPSHNVMRSWHVESNLTEYSPLFAIAQQGRVDLGNLVNNEY